MQSAAEFLEEVARAPFQTNIRTARLRDVEALWNANEQGVRLAFQP